MVVLGVCTQESTNKDNIGKGHPKPPRKNTSPIDSSKPKFAKVCSRTYKQNLAQSHKARRWPILQLASIKAFAEHLMSNIILVFHFYYNVRGNSTNHSLAFTHLITINECSSMQAIVLVMRHEAPHGSFCKQCLPKWEWLLCSIWQVVNTFPIGIALWSGTW